MLSVDAVCAFAFSLGREGLASDRLELHWALLPLRDFSFVLSGLTQPEDTTPGKDLRIHPHTAWWSYGPWAGKRVKSALGRTWTEKLVIGRLAQLVTSPLGLVIIQCSCSLTQFCLWAMLHVHHYIASPATLFRVSWRTHFKNRRISSHGSSSHHRRRLHQRFTRLSTSPWFIMTTFMSFLSIEYLCVSMYYLCVCVYVCVHMEVSPVFFI